MVLSFQGPPSLLLRINLQQLILPEAVFTPWNRLLYRVQKIISLPFPPHTPNVSISCGNQILSFNQILAKSLAATKLGHSKLRAKLWKLFMPVLKVTQTTVILPRN